MFTICYEIPYPSMGLNEEWREQTFETKKKADEMIIFYQSCGSRAYHAGVMMDNTLVL